MRVVILAGGKGTRMQEDAQPIPKPMALVGNKPLIWHIMNIYAIQGYNDFILCLGYKQEIIRDYFLNYHRVNYDCKINTRTGEVTLLQSYDKRVEWNITLIDTGIETQTGGRLKKLEGLLDHEPFFVTYGDGLANVDISRLLLHHKVSNKLGTVTTVNVSSRFGDLMFDENNGEVFVFKEKRNKSWINGGFFVFNPGIFKYLNPDLPLEDGLLTELTHLHELSAYKHGEFWQCCDTQRELRMLNDLYDKGDIKWNQNLKKS